MFCFQSATSIHSGAGNVPLRAANAHDVRGRRRAEMDTAGASGLAEVCKHQTSGYSDRRSRPMSGAQPSSRACCATVVPQSTPIESGYRPINSGSASTGNLLIYREIRPDSLLRSWLRIPVAVLRKPHISGAFRVFERLRHSLHVSRVPGDADPAASRPRCSSGIRAGLAPIRSGGASYRPAVDPRPLSGRAGALAALHGKKQRGVLRMARRRSLTC